ncbi:hypothetical protein JAO29_10505 [Edaphobacter sp. HDX4]|uniref:hypothetical protein n=1 Tax=Edaphobacter sp. HDX4 TaxID=2794064 RepID=UPI002FE686B0
MKSKTITNTCLMVAAAILTMLLALPAEAQRVNMRFSGTAANSTITNLLHPDTTNAEYNLAGKGAPGSFTLRLISAGANSPSSMPPDTCSGANKLYIKVDAGAGVFRFGDNSLLYVQVTPGGSDCIDLAAGHALCIRNLQITGGTGRFKNTSGTLTLTETVVPVLADIAGLPVFFAATGGVNGTISGATEEQDKHDQDNDQ